MKHLHIVSAKVWGGGEQYILNLAKLANKMGDEFIVIADSRYPKITARFESVTTTININLSTINFPCAAKKIISECHKQKISTINYHSGRLSPLILLITAFNNTPCFYFKHNVTKAKNDLYHNLLMKSLANTICVSKAVYDAQVNHCKNNLRQQFSCIPNGINIQALEDIEKIPHPPFTIGYAGRIVENKGISILLESHKKLPFNHKILIAGSLNNDFAKKLHNDYSSDNQVLFLGHLIDLSLFYKSIDVLIQPSIVKESFGLSIVEAMSFEKPVIATNQGGPLEIIRPEVDGLLIPANDVDALTRAIRYLYEHPEERQKWGKNARQRVIDNFSLDRLYKDLDRLYKSVIND